MLPLDKQRAMEKMMEQAQSTYRVTLTPQPGVLYVRDSRAMSQMAALGEVLHAYAMDHRGVNLNTLGPSRIDPLHREQTEIEGAAI